MIPTLLLVGLVSGLLPRPWLYVVLAALIWPVVLLCIGAASGLGSLLAAAALAAANTAFGALIGRSLRIAFTRIGRKLRRPADAASPDIRKPNP